jgi:uncharacterized membrane protein YfcA
MTARERLLGLLAGVLAGTAGGLFGVGGGLLLVPLLTGLFHLTQHQAHGTSLAVIGAAALAAVIVYAAHGNVVWPVAAVVALGSLVTARLGARWATRMSPRGLKRAFAVFLLLVAARLLWHTPAAAAEATIHGMPAIGAGLLVGMVAGTLAGFMGVGGGIVIVPALTLGFGITQQAAQGTSLAAILVTAPTAAFEHARHKNVIWRVVPMLALGAALGAPLSSWAAQRLPHALLVKAFAVFLIANAMHTWARTRGKPQPAAAAAAIPPR